ncbi:hypothetical protein [Bowmanella dokdonensis]|uniref:Uncharacterized protein n=1 Tax=Bowmanella dokdonensis TaxID=751969 RepID=A0A939DRP8_9ALTE|nr:hypothetical protein [Bowmanella dokdonensis]MBN7827529.1 hypothetical protein [Bowmanella dokdonensis]
MKQWFAGLIGELQRDGQINRLDGVRSKGFVPVVVVPRQLYREVIKFFPVNSRAELQRILELEEKTAGILMFTEVDKQGQGYWVKHYLIASSLFSSDAQRPLWLIPHSKWIWASHHQDAVLHVDSDHPYFISVTGNKHQSSLLEGNIHNVERFCDAVGVPGQLCDNVMQVDGQISVPNLFQLRKLLPCLKTMFVPWTRERISCWLVKPAVFLISLFLLYYLLVSGFYLYKESAVTGQADQFKEELNQVLSAQQRLEQLSSQVSNVNQILAGVHHHANVWLVVKAAIAQDTQFSFIRYQQGSYTLSGQAPSASDVLSVIQALSFVRHASFSTPISTRNNRESFAIQFELVEPTTHAPSVEGNR